MRIETLEGSPPPPGAGYWRGLAFDHFDGRTWSITPPNREIFPGSAELGVAFGRRPDAIDLVQRIVREPVESGVLFAAGELRRLQGTVRRLERDSSGGIYATGQAVERVRYTVSSERREWGDSALRRDRAEPDPRHPRRDLQLPALSPAVVALAQRLAAGHEHDADRVRAIERHLIQHGRYTDEPPNPGGAPPVEAFLLGQLAGHCEYFATSMVLLVRSLGIPARIVNGFAGGRDNPIGGFLEVTRSDAHTWVEVRYARAGWVAYDPTPADLRARPAAAVSLSERARQLASAVELWWFQRVVGFDRADQVNGLKQMWLAWQAARGDRGPRAVAPSAGAGLDRIPVPVAALGALVAAFAALALARGRRRRTDRALPAWYARALRLLARRGYRRAPAVTARAFARQVREREPAAVATAFDALTEAYLAQRFGGREAAGEAHLAALRAGLSRR
jgi:transglutaminase-like putative cysteine protease